MELTENGVSRVHGDLVLSSVADEALGIGERHVRRRGPVPLVISDDLDAIMLPNADARVGGSEIDSDRRSFAFSSHEQSIRSGKIVVELNGMMNKCGVISPRFDIGVKDIEGWTASGAFVYSVEPEGNGNGDNEEDG
nr:40S ribosomal protein S15a-1 [Ipomoea batatas]GMD57580.1 40S ribosomal protein S15a-1 [Ipomoea batatas]